MLKKESKIKDGYYIKALMAFTEEGYKQSRRIFAKDPLNKKQFLKEEKAWIKLGKPKTPLVGTGGWIHYNSSVPSKTHMGTGIYAPPIESINSVISKSIRVLNISDEIIFDLLNDKYLGKRDYIILEIDDSISSIIVQLYEQLNKDLKIYIPINDTDFYHIN